KTARRADPVREADGSTTWTVGSPPLIRTTLAPRRDLATPRIVAALTDSWENYQWQLDMEAMARNGERERLHREWGPIDTALEAAYGPGDDPEQAAAAARWDRDPPFWRSTLLPTWHDGAMPRAIRLVPPTVTRYSAFLDCV